MSCFSCGIHRPKVGRRPIDSGAGTRSFSRIMDALEYERAPTLPEGDSSSSSAHRLTFRELAATQNFKEANLIGEGGFGKVFKGRLESDTIVAIKQLNREGHQGSKEFLVEVQMLSMLHHPNLVSLIGYCSEGYERLLVYEYMPHSSLDHHLFAKGLGVLAKACTVKASLDFSRVAMLDLPPDKEPLEWNTRMKIAVGAAKGLTYLHEVNPPVIYRDLKSANILLDDEFNPKLSDFGLAKLGPVGDKTHVSTRVMGTYGYCAPDYATSGKLTVKSDVYSFGVVLLELMTGRMVYDISKKEGEQYLITWARPFLSNRRRFTQLADPLLQGRYPLRPFHQLSEIAALCLREQPHSRPAMREVADALIHVASQPNVPDADRKIRCNLRP